MAEVGVVFLVFVVGFAVGFVVGAAVVGFVVVDVPHVGGIRGRVDDS